MSTLMKRRLRLLQLCVFLLFPSAAVQSVEVIVHPSVQPDQLSSSHLRRIFTIRHTRWQDGLPVKVFILAQNNPIHNQFCIEKLGVFPYQMEKIWSKLLFSGLGEPPQVLNNEQEIIDMIRTTPGAIGYVTKPPQDSGVKMMTINGRGG